MSLIKWAPMYDPFEEMDKFFASTHPMMQSRNHMMPAVDIYEEGDAVIAEAPLPGINIDDVTVSVENDVLTIEGKAEKTTEVDEKNYYRKEVRSGSFHRVVQLPLSVNGEKAEAAYTDGVLKITIPKEEEKKPKKLAINIKK